MTVVRHSKHAVETTEVLDFLKEIVQGVHDPTNGGQITESQLPTTSKKPRKRKAKGDVNAAANANADADD